MPNPAWWELEATDTECFLIAASMRLLAEGQALPSSTDHRLASIAHRISAELLHEYGKTAEAVTNG